MGCNVERGKKFSYQVQMARDVGEWGHRLPPAGMCCMHEYWLSSRQQALHLLGREPS